MGTKENTAGIKRVKTHQNVITLINLDISRNTYKRESGKKSQITTRMKITRRNVIIEK